MLEKKSNTFVICLHFFTVLFVSLSFFSLFIFSVGNGGQYFPVLFSLILLISSPKKYYPNFSFRTVSSGIQENTDRDKSLPVFFYFKKSLSRTLLTTSSIVGHVVLYIFKHTPDVPSMRNTFQWFFFSSTVNSFPFLTIYNDIASYNIFHIIVQCLKKVNTKK